MVTPIDTAVTMHAKTIHERTSFTKLTKQLLIAIKTIAVSKFGIHKRRKCLIELGISFVWT